jgi:hypothetical protein
VVAVMVMLHQLTKAKMLLHSLLVSSTSSNCLPWQHGIQYETAKKRSERVAFLVCGIILSTHWRFIMHTVTLRIQDDGIYEQLMQLISGFRQVEIRDSQSKIKIDERRESLKLALTECRKINAFSAIENPVSWQQQIREEWE